MAKKLDSRLRGNDKILFPQQQLFMLRSGHGELPSVTLAYIRGPYLIYSPEICTRRKCAIRVISSSGLVALVDTALQLQVGGHRKIKHIHRSAFIRTFKVFFFFLFFIRCSVPLSYFSVLHFYVIIFI